MIGEATIKLWFRIVYSLPKINVIKSLIFVIFNLGNFYILQWWDFLAKIFIIYSAWSM